MCRVTSKFQELVQRKVSRGESVLLVAPTGLGKTYAVAGDLETSFRKLVYAVPLRSLGYGIRDEVLSYRRVGEPLCVAVHHGDCHESLLFSEEVVVTTYDQVVCATPGLPLSLPLRAGHAVAGALLMSRLIFDEAHLSWAISDEALTILLAIIEFRQHLGLQTVLLTATLPDKVADEIARRLEMTLVIVGRDESKGDQALKQREANREVILSTIPLKSTGKDNAKDIDFAELDKLLAETKGKRIYFANTVEQIQRSFDRLLTKGIDPLAITVLHNRMPHSWRREAEREVLDRFGRSSPEGDWLLLTNQVAEAGLDISAPLVVSDPAPVDTLVQRSGRCARWFRNGATKGDFKVLLAPQALMEKASLPYRRGVKEAIAAIETLQSSRLDWEVERAWVNTAWGGGEKDALESLCKSLDRTSFALNLFDRSAQERRPGQIARAFREILSVEVAIAPAVNGGADLRLRSNQWPETSTVSLAQAWRLVGQAKRTAKVIRLEDGVSVAGNLEYLQPGDTLIVPPTVAYLHRRKGLCLHDGTALTERDQVALESSWRSIPAAVRDSIGAARKRQGLLEHSMAVMQSTYRRMTVAGAYRETLHKILGALEPTANVGQLAQAIASVAALAAGLHDLGKADRNWQRNARLIDPCCPLGLIGRTLATGRRIGVSHTPPAFSATVAACEVLMGSLGAALPLVRAIALAAARHHSSLLNPAKISSAFMPSDEAGDFVASVITDAGARNDVRATAEKVLAAALVRPPIDIIPLVLPNDDLFPIYALVGRAILMSDREDAAGRPLEFWEVN